MNQFASVPNLLTIARLLLAPFVWRALLNRHHTAALTLFVCAALTDGLDGFLARRFGQTSSVGAWLDPIADKILLSGVYLALAGAGSVPWWLVVVVLGRDVFLLVSSGIVMLLTDFRYFQPSVWGKISTLVQIVCAVAWMLQNIGISPQSHSVAQALVWPTAAVTLWSGLHYSWRTIRSLRVH
jgi:cardiolipin synthase